MKEFVEYVAQSLVEQPDRVRVQEKQTRRSLILKLRVASSDTGRVIGRNGRVANAMRTVLQSVQSDPEQAIILEID